MTRRAGVEDLGKGILGHRLGEELCDGDGPVEGEEGGQGEG